MSKEEKALPNVEVLDESEKEDDPQEIPLPLEAGEPVAPEIEEAPPAPGEAGEVVEPSSREAEEGGEPAPGEEDVLAIPLPLDPMPMAPLPPLPLEPMPAEPLPEEPLEEPPEEDVEELSDSEVSEEPVVTPRSEQSLATPRSEQSSQTDAAEPEASAEVSAAGSSVEVAAGSGSGSGEGAMSHEEMIINQLSAFVNEGLRQRLVYGYARNVRMPSSIVVRPNEEVDAAANGLFQEHGEGDNDEVEHPQPDD